MLLAEYWQHLGHSQQVQLATKIKMGTIHSGCVSVDGMYPIVIFKRATPGTVHLEFSAVKTRTNEQVRHNRED